MEKTIVFNPIDKKTLTEVSNLSTKWNINVRSQIDGNAFALATVYDNSYFGDTFVQLKDVMNKYYPNSDVELKPVNHCEFCGQMIIYVAIIVGINKTDSMKFTTHQIGCDCVGKIFGVKWYGYRTASSAKTVLVNQAKIRARKEKYAKQFSQFIEWLNYLPETLINRNGFLVSMKKLLNTGERSMTDNMIKYLTKLYQSREFDLRHFAIHQAELDRNIEKVRSCLILVKDIDGDNIHKSWSSYSFVCSILNNLEKWHKISPNQMIALNKVYDRYSKKRIASKFVVPEDENIPW